MIKGFTQNELLGAIRNLDKAIDESLSEVDKQELQESWEVAMKAQRKRKAVCLRYYRSLLKRYHNERVDD